MALTPASPIYAPAMIHLRPARLRHSEPYRAAVTRISPTGIRLTIAQVIAGTLGDFFEANKEVEIDLWLPGDRLPVRTRGSLAMAGVSLIPSAMGMIFDLEFLALTAEEDRELRESNPQLVVA